MKVGEKLALGFFVVVLCIWGTVFIARNTYITMHKEFAILNEDIIPARISVADIHSAAIGIDDGIMEYLYHGEEKYLDKLNLNIENLKTLGITYLGHETHMGVREKKEAQDLMAAIRKFLAAAAQIIDLKKQGMRPHELAKREGETFHPAMVALSQNLQEYKAIVMNKFAKAEQEVREARISGVRILLLSGVIITLMAVAISIFVSGSVVKPIYALREGTKTIGEGNLDNRVGTEAKDEIGQLSRAFDEMTGKLKETTVSRQYVENIINSMTNSLVVVTAEGMIQTVNQATCELLGYQPEELISQPLGMIFDEKEQRLFNETGLQELINRVSLKGVEKTYLTKDRDKIPVLFSASVMHDNNDRIQGIICVASDISRLKETEAALRKSEEKYRTILESIGEGYYELDVAGNFTFFNDSLCKIYGYPKDELMGTNIREYTDPETAKRGYEAFNEIYTTDGSLGDFEWGVLKKDGSTAYAEASITLMTDAEGHATGFRGIIRDVTERKRLGAQLQEAQKMEVIYTLAEGIAHQFNNALAAVTGNIELLKMGLQDGRKIEEYIESIKSSANQMAHLTSQLLAYARGGKYNPQPMPLSNFVRNALPLIRPTIDPGITIETDLPPDTFEAKADHTQMQMVLSAIITNANEAVEGQGRITISTKNVDVSEAFLRDRIPLKPGHYVSISVEDDGKGMDEEVKNRIFDPFFTTHVIGRGLGMATADAIVRNHGGWISVDSEPGKGTVVRIYLPAIPSPPEKRAGFREKGLEEPKIEPMKGEGTILVIEDEEGVMNITRQVLQSLGYDVIEARTGKEAVDLVGAFEGQIDLALLDIRLPDMSGDKVYPLIMGARPTLKVIVYSGYDREGPPQEILDAGAEGFLQKPFSILALAEKLREVLEGK